MRWIATTIITLGLGTFTFVAWPYILPVLTNRNLWAAGSLIGILLFTSGHMFNNIRRVPYIAGDGRGGISYFAGGFQNQYGLETQIIAGICEFRPDTLDTGGLPRLTRRVQTAFCHLPSSALPSRRRESPIQSSSR